MRRSTWRSLDSVMLVTLHVAVVAAAVRALAEPTSLVGSFLLWVPVSIVVAVFLSWPIGRAITSAFQPESGSVDRLCPGCGCLGLRPLVRPGGGLFAPVVGHRCAGCGTTYRRVDGETLAEVPLAESAPAGEPEIRFLAGGGSADPDDSGIRFLD